MITILLAAYNGERYLAEQIESILLQTETRWKLVIQDDCSTDGTFVIAQNYASIYPDKIRVVQRGTPSGSAKNNFSSMLEYVDTEYWMTCDQDDVWLSNKIEITFFEMQNLERQNKGIPLLVHTDLTIVNENKNILAKSFFTYQKLDFTHDAFAYLLVQNIVTGCTAMMNRTLLKQMKAVPMDALMHDWWFALVAAAFGRIGFVNEPTILYRQHNDNSVGAKNANSIFYLLKRVTQIQEVKKTFTSTYLQAKCFIDSYQNELPDYALRICKKYIELPYLSKIQKIKRLGQYGFWKSSFVRQLGQLLFI